MGISQDTDTTPTSVGQKGLDTVMITSEAVFVPPLNHDWRVPRDTPNIPTAFGLLRTGV